MTNRPAPSIDLPPRLMLRFVDQDVEAQFVGYYTSAYARFAQASLLLGLLLIIGDFAVDFLAYPAVAANFYRVTVCVPILIVILGYSLHAHAQRYWEPVMSAMIVILAFVMFWVLVQIDAQGGQGLGSWVGVLNFTILQLYCFVILGARFSHALPGGLLILVGFEWSIYQGLHPQSSKLFYLSYHTVTMTIIAAGIGWWREYLLRKNFAAEVVLRRISERQQMDRSLAEATLEASSNGILVVNLAGSITSANQMFADMWRIPQALIAMGDDRQVLELVTEQLKDPQQFLKKTEDLYKNAEAKSRDRLMFSDGRVFERFSRPQRLHHDIVGRVWSFLDITDQVRAEERILQLTQAVTNELARSEHQRRLLQALLDAIPDMVWMKDPQGRFISCNPAFVTLMGRPASDLIGKTDYDFAEPEVADVFQAKDQLAMSSHHPVVYEEWVPSRSDGSQELHETTKIAVRDGNKDLIGVLGIVRDVTGIRTLMQELKDAKDEAQKSNESKSAFLANMSHEIRTPMNAVIGMANLMLNTDLNARQRNYANKIKMASDGLLHIINDILDFSKIEAGKMQMETRPFELETVFEQVSSLMALRAESQGIELAYNIGSEVPSVLIGDALRLGQILINLVSNALKFSSGGNVVVRVAGTLMDDAHCELHVSVSDEGIGMTPEQVLEIFQPFAQADTSTTRQFGGTGLGLAICRHLVGLLNGRIWVESDIGQGSTFHFTSRFEYSADRRKLGVAEFVSKLAWLKSRPILVVDDNPVARQVLQHLIERLGLEVVTVTHGEAAVELLRDPNAPDFLVCLVDWFMPQTDGIETITKMRQVYAARSAIAPPMILVTARSQDNTLQHIADRIDGLLVKPVSVRNLCEEIAKCLGLVDVIRPRGDDSKARSVGWSRFKGLDVLMVEDMDINREFMSEMLTDVGLNIRLANDGLEALAAVKRQTPDLILMDCHMPVMDGYAATRQLRSEAAYADIPIIALTASAMAEDKRRCLAAGMNAFVTKPLNLQNLFAEMLRCMPEGVIKGTWKSEPVVVRDLAPNMVLPDFPGVDTALGLAQVGGRVPLLLRVLKKFRDNQGKSFESNFMAALASQHWDVAERLIHSLKGVSRTLGASDLADVALALEGAVRDQHRGRIDHLFADVQRQLQLVCDGLKDIDAAAVDPLSLLESSPLGAIEIDQLKRLSELLITRDAESVELAMELSSAMARSEHHAQWRAISLAIECYDFSGAIKLLQSLLVAVGVNTSLSGTLR